MEQLRKQLTEREEELFQLQKKKITHMWLEDIDNFVKMLDDLEDVEEKERISGKGTMQNGKQRV